MQKFTPLWRRFIKECAEIQNIKKYDLAVFQSAPYPRICCTLLGILKQFLLILLLIYPKNKENGWDLLFEKFQSDLTSNII